MRVSVQSHKCVGAGQCVTAAPQVFDQNEETGTVILLQETPPPELQAAARTAAHLCPAVAIHVHED